MMNKKTKYFKALIILVILIFLSLGAVFLIDILDKDASSSMEISKGDSIIYISGLAALFIILFMLFFKTYKKLLIILTLVSWIVTISFETKRPYSYDEPVGAVMKSSEGINEDNWVVKELAEESVDHKDEALEEMEELAEESMDPKDEVLGGIEENENTPENSGEKAL